MFNVSLNYLAVFVAGIAGYAVGALWYMGLFGKYWMKANGISAEAAAEIKKGGNALSYFISFVGTLVMAWVLAHFVDAFYVYTFGEAIVLAFWVWLGFIATTSLNSVLWDKKSWGLYAVNNSHMFVALVVMGTILAYWK